MPRLKWDWSDLWLIMAEVPKLAVGWEPVRDRLKEVADSDPAVGPFIDQAESLIELYTDDGRLSWRDVGRIFVGIGPLIGMYPLVRERAKTLAQTDPVLAPWVDSLERIYEALTT